MEGGDDNNPQKPPGLQSLPPDVLLLIIHHAVGPANHVRVCGIEGPMAEANGVYILGSDGNYHHVNPDSGLTLARDRRAPFLLPAHGDGAFSLVQHAGTPRARKWMTFVEATEYGASLARTMGPANCPRAFMHGRGKTMTSCGHVHCENGQTPTEDPDAEAGMLELTAVLDGLGIAPRPFHAPTAVLLVNVSLAFQGLMYQFRQQHCGTVNCPRPGRKTTMTFRSVSCVWMCNRCLVGQCSLCNAQLSRECIYYDCAHRDCTARLCARCAGAGCCWPTCRQIVCATHAMRCAVPGCPTVQCRVPLMPGNNDPLDCNWFHEYEVVCAHCDGFICPAHMDPQARLKVCVCESPHCTDLVVFCSDHCRGGTPGGPNCRECTRECDICNLVVADIAWCEEDLCGRGLCADCSLKCGHDGCTVSFCQNPLGARGVAACGNICARCRVTMCDAHWERCNYCGDMVCSRAECLASVDVEVMEDDLHIRTAMCTVCRLARGPDAD